MRRIPPFPESISADSWALSGPCPTGLQNLCCKRPFESPYVQYFPHCPIRGRKSLTDPQGYRPQSEKRGAPWEKSSGLCLWEGFGNPPPCLLLCTGSSSSFKPRPSSPLLQMQPTFSRLRTGLRCVTRQITECGSPNPSHSAPHPCTPGPRGYGVEISNARGRGSPEPRELSPSHRLSAAPTDLRPGFRLLASELGLGPAHCLVLQTKAHGPSVGSIVPFPATCPSKRDQRTSSGLG